MRFMFYLEHQESQGEDGCEQDKTKAVISGRRLTVHPREGLKRGTDRRQDHKIPG